MSEGREQVNSAIQALKESLAVLRNASQAEIDEYLRYYEGCPAIKVRAEVEDFLYSRWHDAERMGYHGDFLFDVDVKALLDFIYGKAE